VTYIPFKDKTFANVLFSYNGICHLHAEQRYLCIQEVARVLKEKGIFLFTIESKEWYHLHSSLRTVIHAGSEKEFSCPFYRIQKKEVCQMLSELGFAILYEGYKDTIAKERDNYPNCYFFVASRSSLLR